MNYRDDPNRIELRNCMHRGFYRLTSRNLRFGVYNEKTKGFCGLRTKFGHIFVFEEYHVDYDGPYKTAAPMEFLPDELPSDIEPIEYIPGNWCSACNKQCSYVNWPEGGEQEIVLSSGGTMKVPGCWQHLDGSKCENMYGCAQENKLLHNWLKQMESKYGNP